VYVYQLKTLTGYKSSQIIPPLRFFFILCTIQNKCSNKSEEPAMPINYQEIQRQVRDFGTASALRQQRMGNLRQEMLTKLGEYALQQEAITQKVERAVSYNPGLRCAIPGEEPIDGHFPAPALPPEAIILVADGSQINPSRHDQVKLGLVNVGIIRLHLGRGLAPSSIVRSRLLRFEELYTSDGLITEAKVAFLRDLGERQALAEMALDEKQPVMTITDGPLELFSESKTTEEYDGRTDHIQLFNDYLEALTRLSQCGASTAGYVDKPESELVGRLLEVLSLPEEELRQAGKNRPYLEITDESLFTELLGTPGERSAVFGIQSLFARKFKDELSLHFFYINVGRLGHPWLARIEIPAWVVHHPKMLNDLHAVIFAQTEILGNRPYPYVLHRAHEIAVVTMAEKEQVEQMVIGEYLKKGIDPGEKSHKQSLKDLDGRTDHIGRKGY
jgi:hypothetical protein